MSLQKLFKICHKVIIFSRKIVFKIMNFVCVLTLIISLCVNTQITAQYTKVKLYLLTFTQVMFRSSLIALSGLLNTFFSGNSASKPG